MALLALVLAGSLTIGFRTYLLIQVPIIVIGGAVLCSTSIQRSVLVPPPKLGPGEGSIAREFPETDLF